MSVRLDNLEPIDLRPLNRALISVYDKTGLVELASALSQAGVEIVSTGSTAKTIAEAGIRVTPVEDVTGFPEVLEGRVKTLHPMIHAGILADQRKSEHRQQIDDLQVGAFDLVVCNLYPFSETVASGAPFDECVEQIDIGGPSMVRAAAKNHPSVAVVTSPTRYSEVIAAAQGEGFTLEERRSLAGEAFVHTATYDLAISGWFAEQLDRDDLREEIDEACERHLDASDAAFLSSLGFDLSEEEAVLESGAEEGAFPVYVADAFERVEALRYGENPHQGAAVYREINIEEEFEDGDEDVELLPGIANARQLHGKAMSYNNYTDGDAALRAAYDHELPCVAIIKHANPCGIALAEDGALEVLSAKKNLRVLEVLPPERGGREFKQISGGLLVQERDEVDAPGDSPENWTLAAGEPADAKTLADLEFAWRTVRAVRSNAILLVKDGASIGVGMGQVNRVDSCKLAVERANTLGGRSTGDAAKGAGAQIDSAGGARSEDLVSDAPEQRSIGAVAASDAFFPFADGLRVLIDAGVKAVVQPGGSVRDAESIEAAKAAGITMYLTGTRHFAH